MTASRQRRLLRTVLLVLLVLLLILLFPAPVSGQGDTHDLVAQAKQQQLNLQYDEAQKLLEKHLQEQPADLPALNLLASVILYREMFDRGLLESQLYGKKGDIFKPKQEPLPEEFQRALTKALNKAESAAEERLKKLRS